MLMVGLVFGNGRRVVALWIRAAGLCSDYRDYYYFLQSVGRCWEALERRVLTLVLRQILKDQPRVLVANRHGWTDVLYNVYGREVAKRIKTFVATHPTFGGAIRAVVVQEKTGPQFFYCTDIDASVREIVEAFADRAAIEQVFHDVKEVWGSGQQQVRNLW